jgi:hypothetical protein
MRGQTPDNRRAVVAEPLPYVTPEAGPLRLTGQPVCPEPAHDVIDPARQ